MAGRLQGIGLQTTSLCEMSVGGVQAPAEADCVDISSRVDFN